MIEFFEKDYFSAMENIIKNRLKNGKEKKELIDVTFAPRCCGKTHWLINFAKENGYTVVVKIDPMVNIYKKQFNYNKIVSVKSLKRGEKLDIVIDERVFVSEIPEEYNIITGYCNKNYEKKVIKNYL